MRTIAVVTVGRSDYSIYSPLLKLIQDHPDLELRVLVSGMHLEEQYAHTVQWIERDGFPIFARVPLFQEEDTPKAIATAMGKGIAGFAQYYASSRPDLLIVLGDRFEMFAAALAAVPFNIPILHLHGGELTEGAMDDRFRHALTKLSHLHGVATEVYRQRVIQMGEEPWRVLCCGALSLDNLMSIPRLSREELQERFSLDLSEPPLLVTLHPTTSEYENTDEQLHVLLEALRRLDMPVIFTMPNADMAGSIIRRGIIDFCATSADSVWVENFGPEGYFSILREVKAMVGNSSSGLLEAPSFALPVVNIGTRQKGRLRAGNVIDTDFDTMSIVAAVTEATSFEFKKKAAGYESYFGDGHASERLVKMISQVPLDSKLLGKTFNDFAL